MDEICLTPEELLKDYEYAVVGFVNGKMYAPERFFCTREMAEIDASLWNNAFEVDWYRVVHIKH